MSKSKFPKKEILIGKLVNMLLFGIFFVLAGYFVPRIYLEYFDTTLYYNIDLPIQVDKEEYYTGDKMKLFMNQTSMVTTKIDMIGDLVLLREDTQEKVFRIAEVTSIIEGSENSVVVLPLPEDLEEGKYYWQGIMGYDIKGINKNFVWYSEDFLIVTEDVKVNS